jgi:hypothetical protein
MGWLPQGTQDFSIDVAQVCQSFRAERLCTKQFCCDRQK